MRLDLETSRDGPQPVVKVAGDVDLATADRLRDCLAALMRGGTEVVVDLDDVDFIDSSGIGVLVGAVKRARRQGGDLTLVCNQPRILKVFHITGLDQVFGIRHSAEN